MYSHLAYETPSSAEFTLNRAVLHIKSAQQEHRQELEKKDKEILQLTKKLERLQSENRELIDEARDYKRHNDKENNQCGHLLTTNKILEQELSMEKSKSEQLEIELARVRQALAYQEKTVACLEEEQQKANHLIKNLYRKVQDRQQLPQHTHQPPMSHTSGPGATSGLLHTRLVPNNI
jgi:chromosome segregation ATPase